MTSPDQNLEQIRNILLGPKEAEIEELRDLIDEVDEAQAERSETLEKRISEIEKQALSKALEGLESRFAEFEKRQGADASRNEALEQKNAALSEHVAASHRLLTECEERLTDTEKRLSDTEKRLEESERARAKTATEFRAMLQEQLRSLRESLPTLLASEIQAHVQGGVEELRGEFARSNQDLEQGLHRSLSAIFAESLRGVASQLSKANEEPAPRGKS